MSERRAPLDCEILIVGAGLAGLAAANLLAGAGFAVICVDRQPAPEDGGGSDLRTTALLAPSIALLERAGIWDALRAEATPLVAMRLLDLAEDGARRAETRFDAAEIGLEAFGWNLANAPLHRALSERFESRPAAQLLRPARLRHLLARDDAALATLDDGRRIRAQLVVGADGRNSFVREQAGIAARRVDYGQRALVFMAEHETPHENTSIEIYQSEGPFTLAPFAPGENGAQRSGVVWVDAAARIAELSAMPDDALSAAATERSAHALGRLKVVSRRMSWPSATLLADRFHARRVALMAEAAHASPPIGAQGLNISLEDARLLVELLTAARDEGGGDACDLGAARLLERYGAERWRDAATRLAGTAALNAAAIGALAPLRDARRAGLRALGRISPMRQAVMRFGLGGA